MCGLLSWPEEGFCRGATDSLHTPVNCLELPERDQDRTGNSHTCKWFPLSWGLGWWGRIKESLSLVLHKSESAAIWSAPEASITERLSVHTFPVEFGLWNERHPSRGVQLTPEEHLLQFQANVLHWCRIFLKKAAFCCLCPTLPFPPCPFASLLSCISSKPWPCGRGPP